MATQYSEQRANDVAYPPVPNSPNTHGRVKALWFDLNTTDRPIEDGDTVELVRVPANVRIIGGEVRHEAMGANATLAIGVAGTTGKYLAAEDVAAIGTAQLAATIALGFGEVVTSAFTLIGTAAGANFAAAKKLYGYLLYVSAGE